jgi:hypothetical protein
MELIQKLKGASAIEKPRFAGLSCARQDAAPCVGRKMGALIPNNIAAKNPFPLLALWFSIR